MDTEVESSRFSGVKVAFTLQHLGLADMGAPRNDRWGALPPSHTARRGIKRAFSLLSVCLSDCCPREFSLLLSQSLFKPQALTNVTFHPFPLSALLPVPLPCPAPWDIPLSPLLFAHTGGKLKI